MSRRLDLPLAFAAWLLGFAWFARTGNWTPLAVAAVAAAARLVASDSATRRLLVPRPSSIALGAAGAVCLIAATYLAYPLLARAVPGVEVTTGQLYGLLRGGGHRPLALLSIVALVATSEEIVWRGRLLGGETAEAPGATPGGAFGQAVLFAAAYGMAHVTSGSALLPLVAFACGLVWALLRVAGRSLWPAVIAHVVWDFAVLVVWPLAR